MIKMVGFPPNAVIVDGPDRQANQFEKELFDLLYKYDSLPKTDCVHKLKYVLKSVEMS